MSTENAPSPARTLTTEDTSGSLALRVTRCAEDGLIAFPPEQFGCQRCGAHGDRLVPTSVPAIGTVVDAVTVHRHRGPGPEAPFSLATVDLDDGLIVRALVDGGVVHGAVVEGSLVPMADGTEWLVFAQTEKGI